MKNKISHSLEIIPIRDIPDINPRDDIAEIIGQKILDQGERLLQNDIVVITQKIISKSENRFVNIKEVKPTPRAIKMSKVTQKCPELIELILQESHKVLRYNERAIIVEHKLGFICANAGIDHSNVGRDTPGNNDWYLLLPADPDGTAERIRTAFELRFDSPLGVMIIDSHGRAWRYGTVGTSIGISGLPALVDLRGEPDLYGYELKITRVGAADELAGAASLVMGQSNEKIPAVIARGFPYALREAKLDEILRPEDKDMFR